MTFFWFCCCVVYLIFNVIIVPPEVRLNNKRIGQFVDKETILDCEIVAYPHGQMYWTKDGVDIDMSRKDKYHVELYSGNEDSKRKTLSLRVKSIKPYDYGAYTCVAKNYLGHDRETMYLYGKYVYDVVIPYFLVKPTVASSKFGNTIYLFSFNLVFEQHIFLKSFIISKLH